MQTAAPATLETKTVQELHAIAAEAAAAQAPRRQNRLSRAAQLRLIDQLSRWGGSGLALFAGIAIFIMIVPAHDYPVRSAIWAAMVFSSLYLCRRYRKEFRRGERIASRPFRWRAFYASTLAVVSAAFGAGAFLLAGTTAPAGPDYIILLIAAAGLGAAAFNIAHRASALAAGAPALIASAFAAYLSEGPGILFGSLVVIGLAAAIAIGGAVRETERRAAARFPRTTFLRRQVERPAYNVAPARNADQVDGERAAG